MPLVPYQALFDAVKSLGIVSYSSKDSDKSSKIFQIPLVFGFEDSSYPVLSFESYLLTLENRVVKQLKNGIELSNGLKIPTTKENLYVVNWYPAKRDFSNMYRNIPISSFLNAYSALKRVAREEGVTLVEVQDSIDYYYANKCDNNKDCDLKKRLSKSSLNRSTNALRQGSRIGIKIG